MKEKENMSMTELQAIAYDGSIRVPEKLRDDIRAELDTLAFLTETPAARPRMAVRIAGVAASLALIAAIGFGVDSYRSRPKDTFSDPQQAYAMLQESFSFMSSEMDKCMDSMTKETAAFLSKTNQIMDKIN
jgi:uncharacterized protein YfkK (UPF0435 family)